MHLAKAMLVDPSYSSSLTTLQKGGFDVMYIGNTTAHGDFIADNFAIGGTTIQNLTMGIGLNVTGVDSGIMGISFDTGEFGLRNKESLYPNIMDVLVGEKLINRRVFSLWMDDLGIFPYGTSLNSALSRLIPCYRRFSGYYPLRRLRHRKVRRRVSASEYAT